MTSVYVDFITNNRDMLMQAINDECTNMKVTIRQGLIKNIQNMLTPIPYHYENCDGNIVARGAISMDKTVSEFFDSEIAEDGQLYKDKFSKFATEVGMTIVRSVIKRILEDKFGSYIYDDTFNAVQDECDEFSEFLNSTLTHNFSHADEAVAYCKIGDMPLVSLMRE